MKYCILLILLLPGCANLSTGLGGKTHYDVEFVDQTAEQNTQYKMKIKAPAGVDLTSVTGMTYKWTPDGSGDISVSSDSLVNTESQAAALVEVNR